ncbi:hypothetical protein ABH926_006358 [Catenulispora sp. GP43]|uniref:hypothetical protein n=1 Tax=Catenulispora sp. GP43 TaxID=3156263 RepID=UPI003513B048
MSWRETLQGQAYTFYGRQTLSHTARAQGRGTMTCWAFSFGAILNTTWSSMALFTPLDQLFQGQGNKGTYEMVEAINRDGSHGRIRMLARWFGTDWSTSQIEQNFPQATFITGHVVVALAIGQPDDPTQPVAVRYWDPADAQIHTVTLTQFMAFGPTEGFVKA